MLQDDEEDDAVFSITIRSLIIPVVKIIFLSVCCVCVSLLLAVVVIAVYCGEYREAHTA